MQIVKSPLELVDFILLDAEYRVIVPELGVDPDFTEVFDQYGIDMDYAIQPKQTIPGELLVFVRCAINCAEEPLPGYRLFIEGVGHFKSDGRGDVSDDDWQTLLRGSALGIVINSLRVIGMQLTAQGPFGKYVLPSVDLNDLHQKKAEAYQQQKAPRRRKKKE